MTDWVTFDETCYAVSGGSGMWSTEPYLVAARLEAHRATRQAAIAAFLDTE